MAISETSICNMSLARIGAKRIASIDDGNNEAAQCREHYAPARDMLLRAHAWRFALSRAALSADTATPAFEWAYQFILPSDCLRAVNLYEPDSEYVIEGRRLLTDDSTANLVYIKKVTDPAQFDAAFVEALSLALASRLVMPLAQDKTLKQIIDQEFAESMSHARLVDEKEAPQEWYGQTWNEARSRNVLIPKQVDA